MPEVPIAAFRIPCEASSHFHPLLANEVADHRETGKQGDLREKEDLQGVQQRGVHRGLGSLLRPDPRVQIELFDQVEEVLQFGEHLFNLARLESGDFGRGFEKGLAVGTARTMQEDLNPMRTSSPKRSRKVQESTHQRGAEQVAGLDLVGRVDGESLLELGILEPDEAGILAAAPFLKDPPEVPESALGKVGKDKGASLEVFVKIGDEEEPFKNRHVGSLSLALAVGCGVFLLGIDLGEPEGGLAEGAMDEILGAIAVGRVVV